jgi:altronate dehydratase small subunit
MARRDKGCGNEDRRDSDQGDGQCRHRPADIQTGEEVTIGMGEEERLVRVQGSIPYGHKFAVRDIAQGEDIIKYGEVIGRATNIIPFGTHAHIQNIESLRGLGGLESFFVTSLHDAEKLVPYRLRSG